MRSLLPIGFTPLALIRTNAWPAVGSGRVISEARNFAALKSSRIRALRRLLLQHRLIAAGRRHNQIAPLRLLTSCARLCLYDCS